MRRLTKAFSRFVEMTRLYDNWLPAVLSRAGIFRRTRPALLRISDAGSTVALVVDLGAEDVRIVNEMWILRDYLKHVEARPHDPVVMDLGANKGYFATLAQHVLGGVVHCYEPHPLNASYLRANAALIGGSIHVHEVAVTTTEAGEVTLFEAKSPWLHTIVPQDQGAPLGLAPSRYKGGSVTVPAIPIGQAVRDVLERHGHITLLKSDTEGLDIELICAIPPDCLERVDHVVVESSGGDLEPAVNHLEACGFRTSFHRVLLYADRS